MVGTGNKMRLLLCLCLLAWVCSKTNAEVVNGQVMVDGNEPGRQVSVKLKYQKPSDVLTWLAMTIPVRPDGKFSVDVPDGSKVILHWNDLGGCQLAKTGSQSILFGHTRTKLPLTSTVIVPVSTYKVRSKEVRILDQFGEPVVGVPIVCRFWIYFGGISEGEPRTFCEYKSVTDERGVFEIRMVEGIEGKYEIETYKEMDSGDIYKGRVWLPSKEVLQSGEKQLGMNVQKKRLMLEVAINWDPDYSNDQFRGEGARLMVDEKTDAEVRIKDGRYRFYDLKPGKYGLAFESQYRNRYRITRNTGRVDIPTDTGKPVEHMLTIVPVGKDEWQCRGIVLSKLDKRPVKGAVVRTGRAFAHTMENGEFIIKVLHGEHLSVQHEEFEPDTFPVPDRVTTSPLTLFLRPFPRFSGKVTIGEKGKGLRVDQILFGLVQDGTQISVQCNENGEFGLNLRPGNYKLRLMVWFSSEGAPEERSGSRVLLADEMFTMPKDDLHRNLEFPTLLGIKIGLNQEAGRPVDVSSLNVALLRQADSKFVALATLVPGKDTVLYVPPGEYKILCIKSEDLGALADTVRIDQARTLNIDVNGLKWEPVDIDDRDLMVRFGKEHVTPKSSGSSPDK